MRFFILPVIQVWSPDTNGGGGNGSVGSSEAREASISENSGIAKVQRSALRLRFTLFGSDSGETVVQ